MLQGPAGPGEKCRRGVSAKFSCNPPLGGHTDSHPTRVKRLLGPRVSFYNFGSNICPLPAPCSAVQFSAARAIFLATAGSRDKPSTNIGFVFSSTLPPAWPEKRFEDVVVEPCCIAA